MSTQDEEALLTWAEERLQGRWEECTDCKGIGWLETNACPTCMGEGRIPRYAYLEAERALSDEQRAGLGEMVDPSAAEFCPFKLED